MMPCMNGGTCNQDADVTKFTCTCNEFATGDRCENGMLCIMTFICIISSAQPPMSSFNCATLSTATMKFTGNSIIAPLSCFAMTSTQQSGVNATLECAQYRTNVTQKSRLAWLTNRELFKFVRDMAMVMHSFLF